MGEPGLTAKAGLEQGMLTVDQWAEIRRLHGAEGLGIRTIARRLGVARNTVRAAVRRHAPPQYRGRSRGSAVDAYEPAIRTLLQEYPELPATVIAERIGWPGGLTILRERIAALRPLYRPPAPYQRTTYQPGELAQWDLWFPAVDLPVGQGQTARLPVVVGVAGYSRFLVARLVPSRAAHDVLGGHLADLIDLGAVPRLGVYDSEPAIGRRRGRRMEFSEPFQRFRGTLGMSAHLLRPRHPEGKGLVERAIGYLETSFLPGRRFASSDDFNRQLRQWLGRANRRRHRETRAVPAERLGADRRAMRPFPPVLPDVAWRHTLRLGRDHYVRVGTCDYSVHPAAIGRRVEVQVDLDWVVVRLGATEVARHRRCLARHLTLTDPVHVQARRALQRRAATPRGRDVDVEVRELAAYDRLLGVA